MSIGDPVERIQRPGPTGRVLTLYDAWNPIERVSYPYACVQWERNCSHLPIALLRVVHEQEHAGAGAVAGAREAGSGAGAENNSPRRK